MADKIKLGRGSRIRILLSKKPQAVSNSYEEGQLRESSGLWPVDVPPDEMVWLPRVKKGFLNIYDLAQMMDGTDSQLGMMLVDTTEHQDANNRPNFFPENIVKATLQAKHLSMIGVAQLDQLKDTYRKLTKSEIGKYHIVAKGINKQNQLINLGLLDEASQYVTDDGIKINDIKQIFIEPNRAFVGIKSGKIKITETNVPTADAVTVDIAGKGVNLFLVPRFYAFGKSYIDIGGQSDDVEAHSGYQILSREKFLDAAEDFLFLNAGEFGGGYYPTEESYELMKSFIETRANYKNIYYANADKHSLDFTSGLLPSVQSIFDPPIDAAIYPKFYSGVLVALMQIADKVYYVWSDYDEVTDKYLESSRVSLIMDGAGTNGDNPPNPNAPSPTLSFLNYTYETVIEDGVPRDGAMTGARVRLTKSGNKTGLVQRQIIHSPTSDFNTLPEDINVTSFNVPFNPFEFNVPMVEDQRADATNYFYTETYIKARDRYSTGGWSAWTYYTVSYPPIPRG